MIVSCQNNVDVTKNEKKYFYDLKEYFSSQATYLSKNGTRIKKQITKDGKTEERIIESADWNNELKPFADADINKPSWTNSYSTDTIILHDVTIVKYISKEKSLAVKQIVLTFQKDYLQKLEVIKESNNSYYSSNNQYVYITNKGFEITGSQEVMLAKKTNYFISATFIN